MLSTTHICENTLRWDGGGVHLLLRVNNESLRLHRISMHLRHTEDDIVNTKNHTGRPHVPVYLLPGEIPRAVQELQIVSKGPVLNRYMSSD